MISWAESVKRRAEVIHSEIASWQVRAREYGFDESEACRSLYELLDEIYSEDMPLARARDNSDLLLHIEGAAIRENPRISLVSSIFDNVKFQVRDLAKAVAGIREDTRVTVKDMDLGLSGIAKGSLFIGFAVPIPNTEPGQQTLLGSDDPVYQATKAALEVINTVSHHVDEADGAGSTEELASVVDDPKVRDAAMVAVKRIAPSGRTSVSTVGVSGRDHFEKPARLTPSVRSKMRKMLARPVIGREELVVEGKIREIDLDAKRFEVRRVENLEIQDIRCVYSKLEGVDPRRLLDARVRVRGIVERRADEVPRLMELSDIDVI